VEWLFQGPDCSSIIITPDVQRISYVSVTLSPGSSARSGAGSASAPEVQTEGSDEDLQFQAQTRQSAEGPDRLLVHHLLSKAPMRSQWLACWCTNKVTDRRTNHGTSTISISLRTYSYRGTRASLDLPARARASLSAAASTTDEKCVPWQRSRMHWKHPTKLAV
jgi:hypothetical protein